MTPAAPVLADLYLSLAALVALVTLASTLRGQGAWDPLSRRFLFGIRVTMILFAGRALMALTGGDWFQFMVFFAAALVPLAVMILTEGLLRRHAPRWAKIGVGGGAALFMLLAFVPAALIEPIRLYGLLIYQLFGFGAVGYLVLTRDKASLSASENEMVGRLGLSLFLIIPMLVVDFFTTDIGVPVRISALGVLALCWLGIGLGRAQTGHAGPVVAFVVIVVSGVLVGGLIASMGQMGRDGFIISSVMILATLLMVASLTDARALKIEARSHSLLQHMSDAPADDPIGFLEGLRDHPLVEGAVVVHDAQLADLDRVTLAAIFDATPVLSRADPPKLCSQADDHIKHLFDRFAATHIFVVTQAPWIVVALSMPALSTSPMAALELRAVQRMASLMAKTGGVKSA